MLLFVFICLNYIFFTGISLIFGRKTILKVRFFAYLFLDCSNRQLYHHLLPKEFVGSCFEKERLLGMENGLKLAVSTFSLWIFVLLYQLTNLMEWTVCTV